MNIVITLTVLAASKNLVLAETKEPAKESHTSPPNSVKFDPNAKSLWRLFPGTQNLEQVMNDTRSAVFRPAISLTRIAKALDYGVDPYFSKRYFEPFETRPKPITLIAFRKNGLITRQSIKVKSEKSSEAAELQSPYNDVGHFWQDDLGSWK